MTGRDTILSKIRRANASRQDDSGRRATVAERLAAHPTGIVPGRAKLEGEERVALFTEKAESVFASVVRVASDAEVPKAVADYLRSKNLPQAVRRGEDPRLAALPFDSEPQLTVAVGPSDGTDLVGLSHALAGIAETGTVALASGRDNPTTLNFLPEHHLVVVRCDEMVGDYESVWARVRSIWGEGRMPRALNMITGPSRSGDIEQTMLLGAHGPRSLHLIVVG
ncbi:MAG: lactate utilization protein [Hyphomicrobiales bacterium]|nr:lactate utilization protein [Hyphomicrobiales bacterium]